MLCVNNYRLDFVDHINEYCPVQKEQNALFGGWIWTETDPRIPVRKDVVSRVYSYALLALLLTEIGL